MSFNSYSKQFAIFINQFYSLMKNGIIPTVVANHVKYILILSHIRKDFCLIRNKTRRFFHEEGKFKVNNLKAGVYIVTVNLNDFIDYFQVNIVNQDVVRDFKVDRSKNNLDEVFLKVQSVKSEIEKKGFAVNVIETKESATRNLQTNELLEELNKKIQWIENE